METSEIIEKAKQFIEDNYLVDLLENVRTGKNFLEIDFGKIAQFDPELADALIEDFECTVKGFEIACKEFDLPKDIEGLKIRVYNITQSVTKDIWKIRAKDVDTLMTIQGYIRRVGDVQHIVKAARFECKSCGSVLHILMLNEQFKTPKKCACGGTGFFVLSRTLIDQQKIVIEEDPKVLTSLQKPRALLALLEDDLCRSDIDKVLQPSKKIQVSGIVKDKQVKVYLNECRKFMEVNSIDVVRDSITLKDMSQDEIGEILAISKSETLYEDLSQSIVPNIKGHESARIAILLQLMGGVELYIDNVLEERGVIHILLVGSPGTGKSVMLKRAVQFLPGSRFTGGKGSSGVGLVAAVTKDEELGGWALSAGAVAMCSGAMCAIDEVDKIDKNDISHMNNAMVDMKVNIDKATIHGTLETNTAILAAANPRDRIFDREQPVHKQIGLPKDYLDRFDLIYPVESSKKELEKRDVANLVVGKYRREDIVSKPIYPKDLVIKYIAYARQNFKPEITKEVQTYIVDNFINLVKPSNDTDQAYFSYRLLTNIIRLSQAVAKTRLSNEVSVEDSKRAINLLIDSLKKQDIITTDGIFDFEKAEAITPKTKRDKTKAVKQMIKECMDEHIDNVAKFEYILEKATEKGMTEEDLDEAIVILLRYGDIIETTKMSFKLM